MCPLVWGSLYLEEQLGKFGMQFFSFSFFKAPCWILSWNTTIDLFPLKEPLLSLLMLNLPCSHPEDSNTTNLHSFYQHLIFSLLLQAEFPPLDGGPKWCEFRARTRIHCGTFLSWFSPSSWGLAEHTCTFCSNRDDRKLWGHHRVHSQGRYQRRSQILCLCKPVYQVLRSSARNSFSFGLVGLI